MNDTSMVASQVRGHAQNISGIGDVLDDVRGASEHIASNEAYGLLCSWLPPLLAGRQQGVDEVVSYLKENIAMLTTALNETADNFETQDGAGADAIWQAGES